MKLILMLFCCSIMTTGVNADTHIAKSCSYDDVSTAVNAAGFGDTVIVPADTATWDTCIVINLPLSILGAGKTKTRITASKVMRRGFFWIKDFTSDSLVRISGFQFIQIKTSSAVDYSIFISGTDLSGVRIDNNGFQDGAENIEASGIKGVIDNNRFVNAFRSIGFTSGSNALAEKSWENMDAGTGDALFIEDNVFIINADYPHTSIDHAFDTWNGGKLVARYNEFNADSAPDTLGQRSIPDPWKRRCRASCRSRILAAGIWCETWSTCGRNIQ